MSNLTNTLNQIVEDGFKRKLVHNFTEDEAFSHNSHITIEGSNLVNFGSCSYLGLEDDPKLKEGVIDAVQRYGTQFSSSRTYLSLGMYDQLERSLEQIFERPVIATATTTLGHLATMPVVIGEQDAIIMDLQVHSSIQMTAQLLKAKKVPIYVVKHNCMESLEKKIQQLSNKHEKVWYLADGVYSMYGDFAPFQELEDLLNRYKKFHLYIDDAHGMSWTGKNGVGVVRSHIAHHPKMVLAVSLNKSFGAAGGCLVFPDEEQRNMVRNCGSTYIFCGPIQPPMLGAAQASADLHLSEELPKRQAALKELIDFTNRRLDELDLPQFMKTESPLFFIPVGLPKITYDIIHKMREDGFYMNTAAFPAVPMKKSGVRFMINSRLTKAEINAMLERLQVNYITVLEAAGSSCEEVWKSFRIPRFEINLNVRSRANNSPAEALQVQISPSIQAIPTAAWNRFFGEEGNLSHHNLALLEQTFSNQALEENNWDFCYFGVKDGSGQTILKTFYTTVLAKEDMFSPAHVSAKIEAQRQEDPYFLTSKTVMLGTPFTKGRQLYLNRNHPQWKEAVQLLVNQMQTTLQQSGATKLMLRDFIGEQDPELETFFLELGLISFPLLNNCSVEDLSWNTTEEYLKSLGQKYRYNVRKEILKYEERFEVRYEKPQNKKVLKQYYALYEKVFEQALDLNVFKLPYDLFEQMALSPEYDFIQLYLKPEFAETGTTEPILMGVMFSQVHQTTYNALIVGLDYQYVRTQNTYKQLLYQTLLRAKQLGCKRLDLAYTAELEKKKLGAIVQPVFSYVQSTEHYTFSVIDTL